MPLSEYLCFAANAKAVVLSLISLLHLPTVFTEIPIIESLTEHEPLLLSLAVTFSSSLTMGNSVLFSTKPDLFKGNGLYLEIATALSFYVLRSNLIAISRKLPRSPRSIFKSAITVTFSIYSTNLKDTYFTNLPTPCLMPYIYPRWRGKPPQIQYSFHDVSAPSRFNCGG